MKACTCSDLGSISAPWAGNFSKASRRARVFYLRHEIQEDEIHVLDFIDAVAHKLLSIHP